MLISTESQNEKAYCVFFNVSTMMCTHGLILRWSIQYAYTEQYRVAQTLPSLFI